MTFLAGEKLALTPLTQTILAVGRAQKDAGTQTVTTSAADVVGTELNVVNTAETIFICRAVFDVQSTGLTDVFRGLINFDGTDHTSEAILKYNGNLTVTQCAAFLVEAGSYTVKLRAQKTNNSNTVSLFGTNTSLTVWHINGL